MLAYDQTYVFLDLETSGKYPIESEICEIAAIKWAGGQYLEEFQTLIKTTQPMSQKVINIHNITNEMLVNAPSIKDQLAEFHEFIQGAICVAHHAPFDLGFLSYDLEKQNLPLPNNPALCTSLIARSRISNIENHRLQTLAKYFHIDSGQAHRALDDARVCAEVFFECLKTFESNVKLSQVIAGQKFSLYWENYSLLKLRETSFLSVLISATETRNKVSLSYSGGSKPGEYREVQPISVVRNPEGDFLVADDFISKKLKRYYISKVTDCRLV